MTVGFFSPLPPAATGVAAYSEALLPYLRTLGPVVTNPPGPGFDVALYHIGNNLLHRPIYERAIQEPGVTLLHDAVLQHLYLGMAQADGRPELYIDEFVYNYGEWSRGAAEEMWRERARSGADARYFARPMLKRIAACSRALIVHNPEAAALVRDHAAGATIVEIPHLFVRPELPDPAATARLRGALGIEPGTLLVGAFGHQRETKRLPVLLRAFRRARAGGAPLALLLAGSFVSEAYQRAIAPLLDQPAIRRVGYLDEASLWSHAAAVDVCANLRYPSAGETSGIAVRMMGIGKPVIFTAGEAIQRIPEDACLRVEHGPQEEAVLAGYLAWLAREPEAAAQIGHNAAQHIAEHHAPARVAGLLWEALRAVRR